MEKKGTVINTEKFPSRTGKTERESRGIPVFRDLFPAGNGNGIFDGIPREYGNGNSRGNTSRYVEID